MMAAYDRSGKAIILTIASAIILICPFVSGGFFNIDEFVYFIGADGFYRTGGLTVENGIDGVTSDDLRILLLVAGPDGLAPQYPAGTAIAGGYLIGLFGQYALIALNVLAGIGTLFAAHALACRLFNSVPVANLTVVLLTLATFWIEYVFEHWPHSVSVLFTTLALVKFLDALSGEQNPWKPALLSGFAVGAGILFRLDGILVLPAIAAATVLWSSRPAQVLVAGAVGLAPSFLFLSVSNQFKFGTWNPISYGSSGGGTDPTKHLVAGGVILAGLAVLLCLRWFRPFERPSGRAIIGVATAALAIAVTLILPTQVGKLLAGTGALLVDATTIEDPRAGVVARLDGTVFFWGFPKKALFQSLPWLGCLAFLFAGAWRQQKRSLGIVLILFLVWLAPFVKGGWHGGLGLNMRYFLPTLPAIVAIGAWTICLLSDRLTQSRTVLVVGALAGALMSAFVMSLGITGIGQLHQIISTYVFFACVATSLCAGFVLHRTALGLSLATIGLGIGMGAALGLSDLFFSQKQRGYAATSSEIMAERPEPVLYYGPPASFGTAIGHPGRVLAVPPPPLSNEPDLALIEHACAAGYDILATADFAEILDRYPGLSTLPEERNPALPPISEVHCDN